jgi:signal transduction histidine kinase
VVDKATPARLFDPFFSNKDVGIGTELGPAIAYGITKLHEEYIDMQSAIENGTTFKICLPLAEAGAETTKER